MAQPTWFQSYVWQQIQRMEKNKATREEKREKKEEKQDIEAVQKKRKRAESQHSAGLDEQVDEEEAELQKAVSAPKPEVADTAV